MNYLCDKPPLEKKTSLQLTTTQSMEDHSGGLLVVRQVHMCPGLHADYLMNTSKSADSHKIICCSYSMPDLE